MSEAALTPPADAPRRPRERLMRTVAKLTATQFVVTAAALLTGPLQSRALGPTGRGELAAIMVPLSMVPMLLDLGLGNYSLVATARREDLGRILGTVGATLLAIGAAFAAVGWLVASRLADGRDVVQVFLVIGFTLMPFSLATGLAVWVTAGLEEWNAYNLVRILLPVGSAVVFAVLFVFDWLTVATAATTSIVLSFLAVIPALRAVRDEVRRRRVRLQFDRTVARAGVSFGLRSWLTGIMGLANGRLDQLLMVAMVDSSQLGIYAVAVTAAGVPTAVAIAVGGALVPRVAAGDHEITARSLRVTLLLVLVASAALAIVAEPTLAFVFGSDFRSAAEPMQLLLAAGLAQSGGRILAPAIIAAGRPGLAAVAEGLALAITVPGLLFALPRYGIIGAATVSLIAYSAAFLVMLVVARRLLGGRVRDYLLSNKEELFLIASTGRSFAAGLRRTRDR